MTGIWQALWSAFRGCLYSCPSQRHLEWRLLCGGEKHNLPFCKRDKKERGEGETERDRERGQESQRDEHKRGRKQTAVDTKMLSQIPPLSPAGGSQPSVLSLSFLRRSPPLPTGPLASLCMSPRGPFPSGPEPPAQQLLQRGDSAFPGLARWMHSSRPASRALKDGAEAIIKDLLSGQQPKARMGFRASRPRV